MAGVGCTGKIDQKKTILVFPYGDLWIIFDLLRKFRGFRRPPKPGAGDRFARQNGEISNADGTAKHY
jgi:hypothetical protein